MAHIAKYKATSVGHMLAHYRRDESSLGRDNIDPPLWISVGSLPDGRFAELIGFMDIDGVWCVFHAMVPPTKKFKRELGWR